MKRIFGPWLGVLVLLLLASTPVLTQDLAGPQSSRVGRFRDLDALLAAPRNFDQAWRILDRDMHYGRIEHAKVHLAALLARPDLTPENVLLAREKYGPELLVSLQLHPELAADSKRLVDMVAQASLAQRRNAERIRHFIGNLSKSAHQRAYAIGELRKSGVYVVPYFLEALRQAPKRRQELLQGLLSMPTTCWPAVAAILDSKDEDLMGVAIDILQHYGVARASERLWFVAGSPKYSRPLRTKAREALATLTGISLASLPSSVRTLGEIAEAYYDHRVDLGAGDTFSLWQWENGTVKPRTLSHREAEEILGMRAAHEALEIDGEYLPAKVTLLCLALERSYAKHGIDKALPSGPGSPLETSLSVGPQLLQEVLRRGLSEQRTAVVLGSLRALTETANRGRLLGPTTSQDLLQQAMDYPNARVQLAAAFATLELHPQRCRYAPRVIQALIQALAGEDKPIAMVLDSERSRGNQTGQLLGQLGYSSIIHTHGRAGFRAATSSNAVELLALEPAIRHWELAETIANFRADARTKDIAIVVFTRGTVDDRLENLEQRYNRLLVTPFTTSAEALTAVMQMSFNDPMAIGLSGEEKAANRQRALAWAVRLARGELPSFDIRPGIDALSGLLTSAEMGAQAAEALGYLPSADVQSRLALAVLAKSQPVANRLAAANALTRNIQVAGRALDNATTAKLIDLLIDEQDASLRVSLARLAGSFGPTQAQVVERILAYRPLAEPSAQQAPAAKPAAQPKPPVEKTEEPVEEPSAKPKVPVRRASPKLSKTPAPAADKEPAAKPARKVAKKSAKKSTTSRPKGEPKARPKSQPRARSKKAARK